MQGDEHARDGAATDLRSLSGIISYNNNPSPAVQAHERRIALHVVLITVGRQSLLRCLDSFGAQLEPQDHVTVVFENSDVAGVKQAVTDKLAQLHCHANVTTANRAARSGQTGTMRGLVERLSMHCATITGTRGAKGTFSSTLTTTITSCRAPSAQSGWL